MVSVPSLLSDFLADLPLPLCQALCSLASQIPPWQATLGTQGAGSTPASEQPSLPSELERGGRVRIECVGLLQSAK